MIADSISSPVYIYIIYIDSIKNGEESHLDKAITEEELVIQAEEMLKKLEIEKYDQIEDQKKQEVVVGDGGDLKF